MSSIVIYTDKKSGRKYAYQSVSYYDKEKRQPRNKRKMIGVVDPVTGEIVPSSRKKKEPQSNEDYKKLYEKALKDIAKNEDRISQLEGAVSSLKEENRTLSDKISKAAAALAR